MRIPHVASLMRTMKVRPPVKAILCQRFGTPDDLVLADIADPVCGPDEVVARVMAAGLNFFDTLLVAGKYQTKPPFPFSPGGEFAGVIESVGEGVTDLKPGDRVLGYTNFNAARERTAVAAAHVVPIPAALDFDRAAALTITSGRGVGLDIVKHSVEGLGGRVEIRSQVGRGTTLAFSVPLQ